MFIFELFKLLRLCGSTGEFVRFISGLLCTANSAGFCSLGYVLTMFMLSCCANSGYWAMILCSSTKDGLSFS